MLQSLEALQGDGIILSDDTSLQNRPSINRKTRNRTNGAGALRGLYNCKQDATSLVD
jgi:hypothetical protein